MNFCPVQVTFLGSRTDFEQLYIYTVFYTNAEFKVHIHKVYSLECQLRVGGLGAPSNNIASMYVEVQLKIYRH